MATAPASPTFTVSQRLLRFYVPRRQLGRMAQVRQRVIPLTQVPQPGAEIDERPGLGCVQRRVPLPLVLGEDQRLHQLPPIAQEHVLRPAQPDPLGPEAVRPRRVVRGVGVGLHTEPAQL